MRQPQAPGTAPTPPPPSPDPRATSDLWKETILSWTLIQTFVAFELVKIMVLKAKKRKGSRKLEAYKKMWSAVVTKKSQVNILKS